MNTNTLSLDSYFNLPYTLRLQEYGHALPHTLDRWTDGEQYVTKQDWFCPATRVASSPGEDYSEIKRWLTKHGRWSTHLVYNPAQLLLRKAKEAGKPGRVPIDKGHTAHPVEQSARPTAAWSYEI